MEGGLKLMLKLLFDKNDCLWSNCFTVWYKDNYFEEMVLQSFSWDSLREVVSYRKKHEYANYGSRVPYIIRNYDVKGNLYGNRWLFE